MSRKKKVPVEDLRTSLENILSFFSPVELKIKSGKIFLPETMSDAISNASCIFFNGILNVEKGVEGKSKRCPMAWQVVSRY